MSHLTDAELTAWRDHGAGRERVIEHLAACDDCGARYAEMIRSEPAPAGTAFAAEAFVERGARVWGDVNRGSRPWPWVAAALTAAAVLAFLVVARPAPAPRAPAAAVVRGSSLDAIAPAGETRPPIAFRWSSPVDAASYRVVVADADGRIVYTGTAAAETLEAPADLTPRLAPGATFSWHVEALDADGAPLARSPAVRFQLVR
jgi:hypothetical protein